MQNLKLLYTFHDLILNVVMDTMHSVTWLSQKWPISLESFADVQKAAERDCRETHRNDKPP